MWGNHLLCGGNLNKVVNQSVFLDQKTEYLLVTNSIRRHYNKDDVIIRAGEAGDTLFYIIRGSVSVTIESNEGRDLIVAYLDRGHFFGESGLFLENAPRTAWVRAREKTEVSAIPYSQFHQLAHQHSELLYGIGRQLVQRLMLTTDRNADFAFYDITRRLARTLIRLLQQSRQEGATEMRCTRQELARMVGCSREMAGKALKELHDRSLIAVDGKRITILEGMQTFLNDP
jgi:CRP/FNR family cyclic AMP-dependent transcriptional regulator